ncbi:major facilitator superfamily transporter [Diaporthe helianthi]|uniref:Major facilitator superfamily transporter n=1 Tax=Diaporthe helianthi TaxID=158607 RepID=A0A2P5HF56_DIAHE|nr:major facilitator superfamily transporter [Diaporthe helianthi]
MAKEVETTNTERALFDWESTVDSISKESIAGPSRAETPSSTRSKRQSMDIAGSVYLIASDGRLLNLPIPSQSPADPLNFEKKRRLFICATLLIHSAICMFAIQTPGNLYAAFLHKFTEEDMAPFSVDTLSGSPTLMMGLSFFFWIPCSVAFGRRPLIILSAILVSVGSLWAGFTDGYHQVLGGICLMGVAGGATLSVTILQVIDLTFIHERPFAIATFWSVGGGLPLLVLANLPLMVDVEKDFHSLYRGLAIPSIIMLVMLVLFIPETYFLRPPVAFDGRVLVQSGTEKVRMYEDWWDVPGGDNLPIKAMESGLRSVNDLPVRTWLVTPFRVWKRSVCEPRAAVASFVQIFLCVANPLVFWVTLLNAIGFAGMMSIGVGFPVRMAEAPYHLPPEAVSRVNFSAAAGSFLALPASCYMLNNVMKRLTLRNKGIRHAEFYLPAFVLPVVSGALSVFIYGFAARDKWHPAAYHVAYGLNSFSFVSASVVNTIWVVESLPQWAAAGIAVVGGVSYVASYGITAVLPMWNAAAGYVAVNSAIGFAMISVGLLAIPIAFWGKSVRQFINGRFSSYEGGALRPQ